MNYAISGYWRNWERQIGWMVREIVYYTIQVSSNISSNNKPTREKLYQFSVDKSADVKKQGIGLTEQQIKDIEKELREKMNGTT